ncbi:MAG: hypothetical protein OIF55_16850 [Amphritea sp.]|nr:hypothetical protein [Amphritea sp.]
MRNRYGIMAALALACAVVVGCAGFDKAVSAVQAVHVLKERGCDALTEETRESLVQYIRAKYPEYPEGGICDPDWVRDVLIDKALDWEKGDAVPDTSEELGYQTDSRDGQLGKPNNDGIQFTKVTDCRDGTGGVCDGFGVYSKAGTQLHAPGIASYSGSGSGARSLLHASVPSYDQSSGRSDTAGRHGRFAEPRTMVAALDSVGGGSSWRAG